MAKWWKISSLLALLAYPLVGVGQTVSLGGYLSGLYIPMANFSEGSVVHNGWLHNRLNFRYTPNTQWTVVAELRNRALYPGAASTRDEGAVNLSWNWVNSADFTGNSSIERLYVGYKTERFSATLGRQRINWSQTLTFNSNDIFNTYSLFDFDYVERSGSDALRLSYYPSATSVVEGAVKVNRRGQVTAALLHRFNTQGVDVQYLAGVVNDHQLVLGGGFSGELGGVNLRGELSNFYDFDRRRNTLLAALGADYVFANTLSVSGELFYNQQHDSSGGSLLDLYGAPLSPSRLSVTPLTFAARISYPFSPLFSGGFATMCFVNVPLFYFGPSADVSLSDNFTLSLMAQVFAAGRGIDPASMGVGYVRLRYSF